MEISLKKSNIDNALNLINSYIDKKDQSSINACILLIADDNKLSIFGTDNEIGLKYIINDVNIIKNGKFCINASKFINVIKGLKDQDILIKTDDENLFIKQNKSKYKIPLINPDLFYEFPNIENKSKFISDAIVFCKNLKKILSCIDTNNPKIDMNGALIDILKDNINFVGTDGRRLGVVSIDQKSSEEFSLIIPKKAIIEMQKIFIGEIEIFYDENILLAVSENFEFFTKLINSKFQNYKQVLPTEAKLSLTIKRDEFLEAIKSINVICDKTKISFNKSSINFEAISDGEVEANNEILGDFNVEEEFYFGINNRFMIDFLTSLTEDEFILEFNQSNSPIMLKSENFKTLIMPIMI